FLSRPRRPPPSPLFPYTTLFRSPPPGAGSAGAMNAPQTNIELTTDPAPPRKGSNTIRVKLSEANGAPISGAEVSVTFFMPAMPRSEEHTSELQSRGHLVCRLLLE